jgi:hypothetical protein
MTKWDFPLRGKDDITDKNELVYIYHSNRLKDKIYMFTSIDVKKVFGKVQ